MSIGKPGVAPSEWRVIKEQLRPASTLYKKLIEYFEYCDVVVHWKSPERRAF